MFESTAELVVGLNPARAYTSTASTGITSGRSICRAGLVDGCWRNGVHAGR